MRKILSLVIAVQVLAPLNTATAASNLMCANTKAFSSGGVAMQFALPSSGKCQNGWTMQSGVDISSPAAIVRTMNLFAKANYNWGYQWGTGAGAAGATNIPHP